MIDGGALVEMFEEIDSTILEARRRADRGEVGPVWLIARRQTAGRGRRGRTWASLDGNLMATYLGITQEPPARIALRGFAAGVAIAEAIESVIGRESVTLKWPNDVMLNGAKVAGVLLDSGTTSIGPPQPGLPSLWTWVALAFGVNIASHPEALDQRTTSLSRYVSAGLPSPPDLLARIRPRLEHWDAQIPLSFGSLRDAWMSRAHGIGQTASVTVGDRDIVGVVQGLSSKGELKLATAVGVQLISAGDVHFPNEAA